MRLRQVASGDLFEGQALQVVGRGLIGQKLQRLQGDFIFCVAIAKGHAHTGPEPIARTIKA